MNYLECAENQVDDSLVVKKILKFSNILLVKFANKLSENEYQIGKTGLCLCQSVFDVNNIQSALFNN